MTEKKTIRAGIVGAGFSATFHFEALRRSLRDQRRSGRRARQGPQPAAKHTPEQRGIGFFDALEPLLDRVEVLHVCVPPRFHEPVALAGLRRDKFVVCEKPLTGYFGDGSADFHWERADKQAGAGRRPGQRAADAGRRAGTARAGCCTPRTGSTPRPSRRSARSWRRPAGRSSGSTAKRRTAARTRSITPTPPAAAAAC